MGFSRNRRTGIIILFAARCAGLLLPANRKKANYTHHAHSRGGNLGGPI